LNGEKSVAVSIKLPREIIAKIDELKKDALRSRSGQIAFMLREALDKKQTAAHN
jgi:metal-responsive CopG/Arc/MetJ family transcriptional regulator